MKASASALFAAVVQSLAAAQLSTPELVGIATRHGMPMPPQEARLIHAHTESWTFVANQSKSTSRDPGIYSPAFLLEDKTNEIVILRGMERQRVARARSGEPLWRPFSAENVEPKPGGYAVSFANASAFVCAVQLAARGDDKNCQAMWERFRNEERWESDGFRDSFREEHTNNVLLLANCLFIHLRRDLLKDNPGWQEIHAKMKALFTEFPELKSKERMQLFDDLGTTIAAKPPLLGSTEDLVLRLAQFADAPQFQRGFDEAPTNSFGIIRRTILLRGRDAVPELIGLLDDRRLTVWERPAIMNAPSHIQRIGELARAFGRDHGPAGRTGRKGLPRLACKDPAARRGRIADGVGVRASERRDSESE